MTNLYEEVEKEFDDKFGTPFLWNTKFFEIQPHIKSFLRSALRKQIEEIIGETNEILKTNLEKMSQREMTLEVHNCNDYPATWADSGWRCRCGRINECLVKYSGPTGPGYPNPCCPAYPHFPRHP